MIGAEPETPGLGSVDVLELVGEQAVGAVDWLVQHAAELYREVADGPFSLVTASRHDGEQVVESEVLWGPRRHD